MQRQFQQTGLPVGWLGAPAQFTLRQQSTSQQLLVITDMQSNFKEASDRRLLDSVCRQIDFAISQNWPIAVLEFEGQGETLAPIAERLKGYSNSFKVMKGTNDGSHQLLAQCQSLGLQVKRFIVCGVSINACVLETVSGLAYSSERPSVSVIIEACGDHYPPRWDLYPEASNVTLLPTLH